MSSDGDKFDKGTIMSDDIYYKLREHLDTMPAGFPETESGAEIKILKKFFTPFEAEIALHVKGKPEKAEIIAERAGINTNEAASLIEAMAKKGNLFRIVTPSGPRYMLPNFIMGMYEWHVNAVDREIAEYADDIYDALADKHWTDKETKQFRIVPVNKAVDGRSHVKSYDKILELVKDKTPYAVAPCICRIEQKEKSNEISRPLETCLTFGTAALYYIQNGIGKELTEEELVQKLQECEDADLVPLSTNARDIVNMCMCDRESCQFMRYLRKFDKPALQVHASFFAAIDTGTCIGCGKCAKKCQVDAIIQSGLKTAKGKEILSVNRDRCIGCGLCVKGCPENSITMMEREDAREVPATPAEMYARIAAER